MNRVYLFLSLVALGVSMIGCATGPTDTASNFTTSDLAVTGGSSAATFNFDPGWTVPVSGERL